MFDEQPQLAVVDVSFISLKLVLPVLREVGIVEMVALVKPQFEAGRSGIKKGGVVRDGAVRERTVSDISKAATELGYDVQGPLESPLKGPKGNVEYFLYLRDNSLSKAQK